MSLPNGTSLAGALARSLSLPPLARQDWKEEWDDNLTLAQLLGSGWAQLLGPGSNWGMGLRHWTQR